MRSIVFVLFLVLCIACVAQIVHYYPILPDRVVSHFNIAGQADGWSSKQFFMGMYGALLLLILLSFLTLPLLLPKLPSGIINLPNRDYWLAPERKKESCAIISLYLLWIGNATVALLLALFEMMIRSNFTKDPHLPKAFWVACGSYLIFIAVWCIAFLLRFKKPS